MRNLLLWALLFYDVLAWNGRSSVGNYDRDYDEVEANKRHSLIDDRRNWRKKVLKEPDRKDWDDRRQRRHDFDSQRYNFDDTDRKTRGREIDGIDSSYKGHRRQYDDIDINVPPVRSSEFYDKDNEYLKSFGKSDVEKKAATPMNCDRNHERYETCFAGCAAVTCDNPRERLRPCYPFCEQGCICIQPYVRDDRTHKCVMPEECTKGLKGIPDLSGES